MTADSDPGVSSPQIRMRRAAEEDLPSLADICRRAIHSTGRSGYSPGQVDAWASFTTDETVFRTFILENRTWIAEIAGDPAGFSGLGDDGYVASLYVDPRWSRRGVGSALLSHVLAVARGEGVHRFHAAASRVSLPVFLRAGFRVQLEETVERRGVALTRYRVALGGSDR